MPMTTYRPHLRYQQIRDEAKEAASDLFAAKPWRAETDDEKVDLVRPFVARICEAYRVPVPEIKVYRGIWGTYSYRAGVRHSLTALNADAGTITIRSFAVIHLFTGLRAHINSHTGSRIDPFPWACSLFYAVKPTMFRARVREDRIPGVVARATYTQESWDALVEQGLADDTTGRLVIEEVPSEEVQQAVNDFVNGLIEDEAEEGIAEIESMLQDEAEQSPLFEVVAQGSYDSETDELQLSDGLDSLNRDQLRAEAARLNIPGRGRMLAPELREAVRRARLA